MALVDTDTEIAVVQALGAHMVNCTPEVCNSIAESGGCMFSLEEYSDLKIAWNGSGKVRFWGKIEFQGESYEDRALFFSSFDCVIHGYAALKQGRWIINENELEVKSLMQHI